MWFIHSDESKMVQMTWFFPTAEALVATYSLMGLLIAQVG